MQKTCSFCEFLKISGSRKEKKFEEKAKSKLPLIFSLIFIWSSQIVIALKAQTPTLKIKSEKTFGLESHRQFGICYELPVFSAHEIAFIKINFLAIKFILE